jgi:predicted ATPase/DNA-binding CsgD family transcriptional regulator
MTDHRPEPSPRRAQALRLVPPPGRVPPTLPIPPAPLVGRSDEVERVRAAAFDGSTRVVSLTGTGGVGKTRVAIECAHRLWPEVPGPTLFVAARAVTTAEALTPLIAHAAGWELPDESNAGEVVERCLAEQATLLVIDNGEQIAGLAALVTRLVDACPELIVLVTSRRALRVPGEVVVAIEPLPAPTAVALVPEITENEAVTLLVQAARRNGTAFDVTRGNASAVAELCRRLDGLPLALELAAARLRLISPVEMVGLLARRFDLLRSTSGDDTQRSGLWATIDWSYRLLADDDQRRFRALGVFPESFGLGAAAAVAGCDAVEMLDTLTNLVDHHLVEPAARNAGAARFTLLETLREFARAELLAAGDYAAAADAHADHVLELVRGTADDAVHEVERFVEFDAEQASFDAALEWSLESGNAERALWIGAELWRYWSSRGRSHAGRRLVERALDTDTAPPEAKAAGLKAAGELAFAAVELAHAADLFERAIAVRTELGDEFGLADARNCLAYVVREQGDLARAEQLHHAAAAVFRRLGHDRLAASSLNGLAAVAYKRGDYAKAGAVWEQVLEITERMGDVRSQAAVAGNVGIAAFALGDLERAMVAYERGITLAADHGDSALMLTTRLNRAEVEIAAGRYTEALDDLDHVAALCEQTGIAFYQAFVAHHRAVMADQQGRIGAAIRHHVDGLAVAIRFAHPLEATEFTERLAMLAAELGEHDIARSAFTVAASNRAASGMPPTPGAERWLTELGIAADAPAGSGTPSVETLAALVPAFERLAIRQAGAVRKDAPPSPIDLDAALRELGLSAREAEVARMLVAHRTDREIADELYIGIRTVASHVSSVLRKLAVKSRREVAARLAELGIAEA